MTRLFLAIALAVPMLAVGCAAPADEAAADESGSAFSRTFEEGAKLKVTATALNVRARGNPSASILAVASRGDILTVVSSSGSTGWVNVATDDGTEGWASGTYLTAE